MTATPGAPYVFVSYASADRERVLPVVAALRRAGVVVWLDQQGIAGGANYGTEIASAIKGAAALVLLASAASLASRNVKQEVAVAWEYERPYLPLLLEPVAIPDDLKYWLTAAQWVEVLDQAEGVWLPAVLAALAPLGIAPAPPAPATPIPAASPGLPPAGPPPIGRERELGLLRERLEAARAGRGGLVLIGGEAGVGKTTLAEAILHEGIDRGALALVGRCYDLAETPPYGPWLEAVRGYRPEGGLPALPAFVTDPAALRALAGAAALQAATADFFAAVAAARPLVLLLDDLHWADPASLDLLRVVARQAVGVPLLLLVTYRSDELTRRHPLYALLPLLVREAHADRLDVHPLDDDGLRSLVAARYDLPPADAARLVAYLRARAEGNAFFAGELLRALEEAGALRRGDSGWMLGDLGGAGVPPLLRQVLDTRLDRLGEEARRLLAVAAVLGQGVTLALWQAVAEADEEALLEVAEWAGAARLVDETDDGIRFAHALVREALYEGIPGLRRRAWHRRAAEALLATPRPDPDAVADHLQRAGDPRAQDWLVRAGERAEAAYAWVTAAARFEAALALLERAGGDATARAALLLRLGLMLRYADPHRALAHFEAAAALGAAGAHPRLTARARAQAAMWRVTDEGYARPLTDLRAAVAAFEATPDDEPGRRALLSTGLDPDYAPAGLLTVMLAASGHLAEAVASAEAVLARAEAHPAGRLASASGEARLALGWALAVLGRPAAARRALEAGLADYRAAGHRIMTGYILDTLLQRVLLPYATEERGELRRVAGEAAATLDGATAALGGADFGLGGAGLAWLGGEWAVVRERGLAVLTHGTSSAVARTDATVLLASLAVAQRDRDLGWRLVREGLPAGLAEEPGNRGLALALAVQRLAAALALAARDHGAARDWLAAHDRWLGWSGAVLWRAEGALGWAAYHRAAGDPALARQHAERALAHASDPRQPLALLAAQRLLGELASEAGRFADAARHLDAALALAAACEAPYERALTLLALADLRAATGDSDAARALVGEVRGICEPLGAQPALARVDALAVRLEAAP